MTTSKGQLPGKGALHNLCPQTQGSVVPLLVHRGRASKWVRGRRGLRGDSPGVRWKEVIAGQDSEALNSPIPTHSYESLGTRAEKKGERLC